jgi:6-phosphogluconolactonase (cycloisomerase 2 family)
MGMRWSRREFVQWMGYSSLASAGMSSPLLAATKGGSRAKFAYVTAKEGADEGIHAYVIGARGWKKLQMVKSERPVSVTLSPDRRFLYAVNEVASHKGLPVGTVEAFAVEQDGRLRLLNRRTLALSATDPRHAAVTPDGGSLVIAVRGGGAYNVLPIAEDGSLGSVSGIVKEIGVTHANAGRRAEPHMVAFDKAGRVVSVDAGTNRLNVFSVKEGRIEAQERLALDGGSRPTQVSLHPAGDTVYVMHEDGISCHRYDANTGRITGERQQLSMPGTVEGPGTMTVHPSGRFLYASQRGGGIAGWHMAGSTARPLGLQAAEMGELNAIEVAPDGVGLLGVSRSKGTIQSAEIDPSTGRVQAGRIVARVDSPSSLAVLYS